MIFEWLFDPGAWLSLITLVILEIILGVDNIIFLVLVVARLPQQQQSYVRRLGLTMAMIMRLLLLLLLAWISHLERPLFYIYKNYFPMLSFEYWPDGALFFTVSARDLILFLGGLFLIWKGIFEIIDMFRDKTAYTQTRMKITALKAIVQIVLLDIVFSLDSVITAIGLSSHLFIMCSAVIIAVLVMMFAAKTIGKFVQTYPTVKMLALVFLVLIGIVLVVDSFHYDVPKGYIYFALFFSITVESLNLIRHSRRI